MRTYLLWLIHLYTALGIPIAGLTLYFCVKGEIKIAFFFMFLAIMVDATDGFFARQFNVSKGLPKFDGRKLDDLVDFLNYVLVPVAVAFILRILPRDIIFFGILPVMASAYGFCQVSAKTENGFFTGFPSYWNLVVFYLYLFELPTSLNIIIFTLFSAAVFIPIKYIVPFKTKPFAGITNIFCVIWCFNLVAVFIFLQNPPTWLVILSVAFPVYYLVLSVYLYFSKRGSNTT